jgi:hypothetical protein
MKYQKIILLIVISIVVTFAGGTSLCMKPYDASVMASWAQAVGSIAAIIGAFMISDFQSNEKRKLAQEALQGRQSVINFLLDDLYEQCMNIKENFNENDDFNGTKIGIHYTEDLFDDALYAVQRIPLFKLNSYLLVKPIIGMYHNAKDLNEFIKEARERAKLRETHQRTNNSKFQNYMDNESLKEAARQLIEKIIKYYSDAIGVTGGKPIVTF